MPSDITSSVAKPRRVRCHKCLLRVVIGLLLALMERIPHVAETLLAWLDITCQYVKISVSMQVN